MAPVIAVWGAYMEIKKFPENLIGICSTRFQWALHMFRLADQCKQRRQAHRQSLKTRNDLDVWAAHVRRHFLDNIGGLIDLPERTDFACEKLANGHMVLVLFADVRGRGAAQASLLNCLDREARYGTEFWFASYSQYLGISTAAQRTFDVFCWIQYLQHQDCDLAALHIIAHGKTGLHALFAAVLAGKCASFHWTDAVPDWDQALAAGSYDYTMLKESTAVFGIANQFSLSVVLDYVGATTSSATSHPQTDNKGS